MGKTYIKIIFREIKESLGRFLAIFSIVALGVGFLAGLLITTPNMKLSTDQYYKKNNMADIVIKSQLGLTEDDLKEVSSMKEIDYIMPAYVTDALMKADYGDETLTTRVHGLPLADLKAKDSQFINGLEIIQGRMPQTNNECVVEVDGGYLSKIEIGTSLTIYEEDEEEKDKIEDTYKNTQYTVVGVVANPYYFSKEREPSSKGDGRLGAIIYMNEENYDLDVYTDFFIKAVGTDQLQSFTDEYEDYLKEVVKKVEKLGKIRAKIRYRDVIGDANEQLDDAKDAYKIAEKEANMQLTQALADIQLAKSEIIKAERDLLSAKDEILTREVEFEQKKLASENQIRAQEQVLREGEKELNSARAKLINARSFIGIQAYNEGINKLLAQESELIAGKALLASEKAAAGVEFAKAQDLISQGQADIRAGEADLKKAKQRVLNGEADYRRSKEKVEKELEDANFQITAAEEDIEDIKDTKWYVLDGNSNISYASFSANVEKVGAIAKVFPVFFLLVAALVALTTMTRMVDEGRTQIGTLKALGYTNGVIMSKYIIYCGLASLFGSLVGLIGGFELLPRVIWSTYGTMYRLPPLIITFDLKLGVISSVLAFASTMIATISAASHALKEKPSTLMLPRAPKAGKRIFLERIGFIWSRMTFTYKATARNLIRYKKNFFMTVIGISGCTALIVAGFGLRDSIVDIASTQFDEIFKYDLIIEKNDSNKSDESLEDFLKNPDKVRSYAEVFQEGGKAYQGEEDFDVGIMVPKESSNFKKFIALRDRKSKAEISFNNTSVVATEKLADALEIQVGDTFILENSDDIKAEFTLTGVTENYTGSYIYINKEDYIKAFTQDFSYDTLMVKSYITEPGPQDIALVEILRGDTVLSAEFNTQTKETYDKLLESISFVVIVLILAAGALAIIVLYNLTNINIEERRKELATLKVLGFHNQEVAAYIYRETTILSMIGTGVGLMLGKILHSFIIKTAESPDLMFGRQISLLSFGISAVITLLFSFLVQFLMYKKLKNIEMVDSMKAIDR